MEKGVVCHNPHPVMSFLKKYSQNSLLIDLYISVICNVRMMLERIAIVIVRWTSHNPKGPSPLPGFTLTGA